MRKIFHYNSLNTFLLVFVKPNPFEHVLFSTLPPFFATSQYKFFYQDIDKWQELGLWSEIFVSWHTKILMKNMSYVQITAQGTAYLIPRCLGRWVHNIHMNKCLRYCISNFIILAVSITPNQTWYKYKLGILYIILMRMEIVWL